MEVAQPRIAAWPGMLRRFAASPRPGDRSGTPVARHAARPAAASNSCTLRAAGRAAAGAGRRECATLCAPRAMILGHLLGSAVPLRVRQGQIPSLPSDSTLRTPVANPRRHAPGACRAPLRRNQNARRAVTDGPRCHFVAPSRRGRLLRQALPLRRVARLRVARPIRVARLAF
jgi:hypothetical protein